MESPPRQTWTSALRTVAFALMAAAILLGIVSNEYVPFRRQLQPRRAALLARGGDNVTRAYYLALAGTTPRGLQDFLGDWAPIWAEDLYRAAYQADPSDFRAALSLAIILREMGQPDEVRSLLRPIRPGEFDEKTRRELGAVYALAYTDYPALSAVEQSREYLSGIAPGPLLTAAGYRANAKPDLAQATLNKAAKQARPLVGRFVVALVIDGAIILCGLVMVVAALVRRRTGAAARREPFPMSPSWGTREATEALVVWIFARVFLSTAARSTVSLAGDAPAYLLLGPSVLSALVAIGWVWMVARLRAGFGWDFGNGLRRIAIGAGAAGLVVLPVLVLHGVFQVFLREKPADNPILPLLLIPDTWLAKAALVLGVGVVAPALEETLFRGILFGGLRRRWSFWPAALVAAAVFAVVHLNLAGFVAYALLGLLLAYLFERSRSLVTAWAAHAAFNIFSLMMALVLFG